MKPIWESESAILYCGECEDILPFLADNSVDAIVTDPPGGIGFMGKDWDKDKGGRDKWVAWMTGIAAECFRILKPGGHALVWALPRTSHWTATAWEDAGFEIRDRIAHVFGSGFPKSADVAKQIDASALREQLRGQLGRKPTRQEFKEAWAAFREVVGPRHNADGRIRTLEPSGGKQRSALHGGGIVERTEIETVPTMPEALRWQGWGTALKPAVEDWWLLRKPCGESTVAGNVLEWGTGGINIDACRVEGEVGSGVWGSSNEGCQEGRIFNASPNGASYRSRPLRICHKQDTSGKNTYGHGGPGGGSEAAGTTTVGRYPANLIHDGSDEVLAGFPNGGAVAPVRGTEASTTGQNGIYGHFNRVAGPFHADSGSAARFFYCPKASKQDRDEGCEDMPTRIRKNPMRSANGTGEKNFEGGFPDVPAKNGHPTVKATALMRYLCRLVTPPNGIVLDPFCGSGSTLKAAVLEGFGCIGIDKDPEYCEIARARTVFAQQQPKRLL